MDIQLPGLDGLTITGMIKERPGFEKPSPRARGGVVGLNALEESHPNPPRAREEGDPKRFETATGKPSPRARGGGYGHWSADLQANPPRAREEGEYAGTTQLRVTRRFRVQHPPRAREEGERFQLNGIGGRDPYSRLIEFLMAPSPRAEEAREARGKEPKPPRARLEGPRTRRRSAGLSIKPSPRARGGADCITPGVGGVEVFPTVKPSPRARGGAVTVFAETVVGEVKPSPRARGGGPERDGQINVPLRWVLPENGKPSPRARGGGPRERGRSTSTSQNPPRAREEGPKYAGTGTLNFGLQLRALRSLRPSAHLPLSR